MPPLALNESQAQVHQKAGLCTDFMSAAVIGAEGLGAMQMQTGRSSRCMPVVWLRFGLHRPSAHEMPLARRHRRQ